MSMETVPTAVLLAKDQRIAELEAEVRALRELEVEVRQHALRFGSISTGIDRELDALDAARRKG